jgi:hypothetical protein
MKTLYTKLYGHIANINNDASVAAVPPMYAFLGFDSNIAERPSELIENSEWVHIGVSNLTEFYQGIADDPFFQDWILKDYPAPQLTAGCCGVRNLGRMALMCNIELVKNKLSSAINLMTAAPILPIVNPTPVVYTFCSVSGGSGSGMLMDVNFLLRQLLPNAEFIGMIGVLDGEPNMSPYARNNLLVNTYGALKELNAFMTGTAEGLRPGTVIRYPYGVHGLVDIPFKECHLVSPYNEKYQRTLNTQGHLTSFMARTAFMMSAYSFNDPANPTPDYAGVMVNNLGALTARPRGAAACYLVPGMGQAHFPVESTANLFAIEAAIEYLKTQKSGNAPAGDEPAREFFQVENLSYQSLKQQIILDPKTNFQKMVGVISWDDILDPLFEKRYENRDQILGYGEAMPDQRGQQIVERLSASVERIKIKFQDGVSRQYKQLMTQEGSFLEGAIDFLKDLSGLVKYEMNGLDGEIANVDKVYTGIKRTWTQEIRPMVEDVCTNDGYVDWALDSFKCEKVKALYYDFMAVAEDSTFKKTVNVLCRNLLIEMKDHVNGLVSELMSLQVTMGMAVDHLSEWRLKLATRLHHQSEGRDPSVMAICSYNVLNQEWRDAWKANNPQVSPAGVLDYLLRSGWHPSMLQELKPEEGNTPSLQLAKEVLERVAPVTNSVAKMTPINVLQQSADYRGKSPGEIIQLLYDKINIPQMNITSQNALLMAATIRLIFCGGINPALQGQLQQDAVARGLQLSVSNNLETHRINFFSVCMPIALAGCNMVRDIHEKAYNMWRSDIESYRENRDSLENKLRQFHCFPRSFNWPSPTEFTAMSDRDKELFAYAFALSEIFPVRDADKTKMAKMGTTPKEKAYGIFQLKGTYFWMMPFFTPDEGADAKTAGASPQGKPVKLGANVCTAYKAFRSDENNRTIAGKWVQWFEENWGEYYTAGELRSAVSRFQEAITERKGKVIEMDQCSLLDEISRYINSWSILR